MKTQKLVTRKISPIDNALARFQAMSQAEREVIFAEAQGKFSVQFNPLETEALQMAADTHNGGDVKGYIRQTVIAMASSDVEVVRMAVKRKACA